MDMASIGALIAALAGVVANLVVAINAPDRRPPKCVPARDPERELAVRMAWEEIHEIERVYAP